MTNKFVYLKEMLASKIPLEVRNKATKFKLIRLKKKINYVSFLDLSIDSSYEEISTLIFSLSPKSSNPPF